MEKFIGYYGHLSVNIGSPDRRIWAPVSIAFDSDAKRQALQFYESAHAAAEFDAKYVYHLMGAFERIWRSAHKGDVIWFFRQLTTKMRVRITIVNSGSACAVRIVRP